MAVQYKIAPGPDRKAHPTRKWKASAAGGAGIGGVVGIVAAYVVAKVDPAMPPEVLAAVVWLVTWLLTQTATMAAGYVARPDAADRPVVDQAASKRPVEPLPPPHSS